jgi:hypothetical protein
MFFPRVSGINLMQPLSSGSNTVDRPSAQSAFEERRAFRFFPACQTELIWKLLSLGSSFLVEIPCFPLSRAPMKRQSNCPRRECSADATEDGRPHLVVIKSDVIKSEVDQNRGKPPKVPENHRFLSVFLL